MRPLLLSDVTAAARALLAVPEVGRHALCARLLREADWADRYARRLGKVHPLWGNGTLKAAAFRRVLAAESTFDDLAYCSCFELVLTCLADRLREGTCKRA